MVEYGLGAAAAGTAGAGARVQRDRRNLSNSDQDAQLDAEPGGAAASTTLPAKDGGGEGENRAAHARATPAAAPPPAPAKPAVVYEDPAGIKEGMEQAELIEPVRRADDEGHQRRRGESLTYDAKDASVEVEMRDGKVYSVQTKSKPRQAAVVLLQ